MKKLLLLTTLLTISACATQTITPQATGGSKADGTVTLSYRKNLFSSVVVDSIGAQMEAQSRCQAWGYTSAEKFGGWQTQCNQYGNMGCLDETIHINYQCNNNPPIKSAGSEIDAMMNAPD